EREVGQAAMMPLNAAGGLPACRNAVRRAFVAHRIPPDARTEDAELADHNDAGRLRKQRQGAARLDAAGLDVPKEGPLRTTLIVARVHVQRVGAWVARRLV